MNLLDIIINTCELSKEYYIKCLERYFIEDSYDIVILQFLCDKIGTESNDLFNEHLTYLKLNIIKEICYEFENVMNKIFIN